MRASTKVMVTTEFSSRKLARRKLSAKPNQLVATGMRKWLERRVNRKDGERLFLAFPFLPFLNFSRSFLRSVQFPSAHFPAFPCANLASGHSIYVPLGNVDSEFLRGKSVEPEGTGDKCERGGLPFVREQRMRQKGRAEWSKSEL